MLNFRAKTERLFPRECGAFARQMFFPAYRKDCWTRIVCSFEKTGKKSANLQCHTEEAETQKKKKKKKTSFVNTMKFLPTLQNKSLLNFCDCGVSTPETQTPVIAGFKNYGRNAWHQQHHHNTFFVTLHAVWNVHGVSQRKTTTSGAFRRENQTRENKLTCKHMCSKTTESRDLTCTFVHTGLFHHCFNKSPFLCNVFSWNKNTDQCWDALQGWRHEFFFPLHSTKF